MKLQVWRVRPQERSTETQETLYKGSKKVVKKWKTVLLYKVRVEYEREEGGILTGDETRDPGKSRIDINLLFWIEDSHD